MSGFVCPFCHLVFALRPEWEDHIRREHPDRQPAPPAQGPSRRAPLHL